MVYSHSPCEKACKDMGQLAVFHVAPRISGDLSQSAKLTAKGRPKHADHTCGRESAPIAKENIGKAWNEDKHHIYLLETEPKNCKEIRSSVLGKTVKQILPEAISRHTKAWLKWWLKRAAWIYPGQVMPNPAGDTSGCADKGKAVTKRKNNHCEGVWTTTHFPELVDSLLSGDKTEVDTTMGNLLYLSLPWVRGWSRDIQRVTSFCNPMANGSPQRHRASSAFGKQLGLRVLNARGYQDTRSQDV